MIQRPDAHTVVYVLDGNVEVQIGGGTPGQLGPGQKDQHAIHISPRTDHGILAVLSGGWKGGSCLESVFRFKRYSDLLSLVSGVFWS